MADQRASKMVFERIWRIEEGFLQLSRECKDSFYFGN